MVLSVYQINNVLRVYKNQLRHNKMPGKSDSHQMMTPDKINISAGARRKLIVEQVASDIVNRITSYGPRDTIEKEVFKKLETEYGAQLDIAQLDSQALLFKVIGPEGESVNSLSIEDSSFLAHKLHEIAMETVDKIEQNKPEI